MSPKCGTIIQKWNFKKFKNFLDTTTDDKDLRRFVTKKLVEVYDKSGGNYNFNKEFRSKTSMVRSDLCDFNDAYIFVKGIITVDKKKLLLMILKHPIIQQLMQLLLILQMVTLLVKKSWFLKTIIHLSIAFQTLME